MTFGLCLYHVVQIAMCPESRLEFRPSKQVDALILEDMAVVRVHIIEERVVAHGVLGVSDEMR